ncbi:MAG TPA: gliding motility-associated C-terminal domain-containing protein [Chitinophagaceae bacterium]
MDPNTIYSNGNLVVACNWSGETGLTGASSAGSSLFVCAGSGQALFSTMPTLITGHNYLLLVSHFTNSQSGYTLEFKGGTAVITDTNVPRLRSATSNCGGDVVRVGLNKKIKCSSIAANGSDFFITPGSATVISAKGFDCTTKFDTDSIELKLDRFLPPGNYTLNVKGGSDGNTLLDFCDNPVPATDVASFTVIPVAPTPMDSLTAVTCAPRTLQLVFTKPIMCASIAADGSDFIVNGSYPAGINAVTGNCSGGLTNSIVITLAQPLERGGNFTIQLQRGTDGNTLMNECATETPAGSFIPFLVKDTVNADFTYSIQYDCTTDLVDFVHPGGNGVNTWSWNLDDGIRSNLQSPQAGYTVFGPKTIQLKVSNGFCSDSTTTSIVLANFLKADFKVFEDNCPQEPVLFTANSVGKVVQHDWNFGDGGFGSGATTSHVYSRPSRETIYNVRYTVTDSFGCSQSIQKPVKIYISCVVAVPNAFTPNGDRKNDFLYPLNAVKADNLEFTVYNRWGQMIFNTKNWKQGWDGRFQGREQPTGTYVWVLRYVNRDTGKKVQQRGYAVLVR